MLSKRSFCALFTVAMLTMVFSQAASAATVFDLRGHGGSANSYSYTEDGITLTVTATSNGNDVWAHQNSRGMGVKNGWSDNTSDIDGSGWVDTLWLTFSKPVTLSYAWFANATGGDEARIVDGNSDKLADINLTPSFFGYKYVNLDSHGITGTVFGFTVTDYCDDYRIKKIAVDAAAVPTPSAAAAGLAVFGLASLRRRRKLA